MKTSVLFIFALVIFISELRGQLPDFSKAVKVVASSIITDTIEFNNYSRDLELLNACEVGSYEVTFYFQQTKTSLWEMGTYQIACVENKGLFSEWSEAERKRLSSSISSMGSGKWYAVIKQVGCGWVFEYDVGRDTTKVLRWRVGCK